MTCFRLIFVVTFALGALGIEAAISDKRLCANEDCTEPISIAVTSIQYSAPEEGLLSFPKNKKIQIYSKSAGTNPQLWGAEINGKRGYVNKDLIKEQKVLQAKLPYVVDTEFKEKNVPSESSAAVDVEPNKHSPIIVDGTTIYSPDAIDATSVIEEPLPTTALPQSDVYINHAMPNIVEFVTAASNQDISRSEAKIDPEAQSETEEQGSEEGIKLKTEETSSDSTKVFQSTDDNIIKLDPAENDKISQSTDENLPENIENINLLNPESNVTNLADSTASSTQENVISSQEITDSQENIGSQENISSQENESVELSDAKLNESTVDEKPQDSSSNFFSNVLVGGITHFLEVAEKLDELKNEGAEQLEGDDEQEKETNDFLVAKESENMGIETDKENVNINAHAENNLSDSDANLDINNTGFNSVVNSNQNEISTSDNAGFDSLVNSNQNKISTSDNEDFNSAGSSNQNTISTSDNTDFNSSFNSNQNEINTSDNSAVVSESQSEGILKLFNSETTEESLISDKENSEVIAETETNTDAITDINTDVINEISKESENNLKVDTESKDEAVSADKNAESSPENDNAQGFPFFGYFFGSAAEEKTKEAPPGPFPNNNINEYRENYDDVLISKKIDGNSCDADPSQKYCSAEEKSTPQDTAEPTNFLNFNGISLEETLMLLGISGVTVVVFLWGYLFIDKMRKEAPLIAKINNLEKALLVSVKENEILTDKINENKTHDEIDFTHSTKIGELSEELERVNAVRLALEEQVQTLEKELENSTEVGLELNKMLSEVLSSQNCSDTLMSNIEQLQRQLVEQQSTINTVNAKLNDRDTENHELQLELEINNKKVLDLQAELDKMVVNLLKIEEEKDQNQVKYEAQIVNLNESCNKSRTDYEAQYKKINVELSEMNAKLTENERRLELKINEYNLLKASVKDLKNNVDFESLLSTNTVKAEMQQLQRANASLSERLQHDQQMIQNYEKDLSGKTQEVQVFKQKYEQVDKEKVEALTKLEVLNTYFKQREAELQKELTKHESMWLEKQGETTSISERIKFMQEEIQNFKAQNTSLKQEIVSQEVELKSQISVLEKKAHENWVAARQAERKFEDARQEAAQLRNRLTLRERSLNEEKTQNRLQSPLESNGDHTPHHITESPASPPLLYGTRDHLTTSPPLPGMHGFLPPPPFMPPPIPGMPPFMPPPPAIYPGDHRPPPLGRMSSPPINSRYSPDSRPYSPYDRNSPSPTDDEYYGNSHRGYNPYNGRDKRDYGRPPPPRNMLRNNKGAASSGSGNSNESLEKINRHNSKV